MMTLLEEPSIFLFHLLPPQIINHHLATAKQDLVIVNWINAQHLQYTSKSGKTFLKNINLNLSDSHD